MGLGELGSAELTVEASRVVGRLEPRHGPSSRRFFRRTNPHLVRKRLFLSLRTHVPKRTYWKRMQSWAKGHGFGASLKHQTSRRAAETCHRIMAAWRQNRRRALCRLCRGQSRTVGFAVVACDRQKPVLCNRQESSIVLHPVAVSLGIETRRRTLMILPGTKA